MKNYCDQNMNNIGNFLSIRKQDKYFIYFQRNLSINIYSAIIVHQFFKNFIRIKRELYVDCELFMQIIYFSFIHSFITYVLHILHKLNIMNKFNHILNKTFRNWKNLQYFICKRSKLHIERFFFQTSNSFYQNFYINLNNKITIIIF